MLPDQEPGRVLLATTGGTVATDFADAGAALGARHVAVDLMPTTVPSGTEMLVQAVEVPDAIHAGDNFTLAALIQSRTQADARLGVLRDRELVVERDVILTPGPNRIAVDVPDAEAGRALYEVTLATADDGFATNNRNGAFADVRPAPRIAIVTPQPDSGGIFAEALSLEGMVPTVLDPARTPWYMSDWLDFDAVVMLNVPAIDLDTRKQELIEDLVGQHGRALLLLGGENSFGPGGYYQTPLERVSPLSSMVPREAPRAALVFVLDRSGSMVQRVGDVTRLDVAKAATLSAIRLLHEQSQVAVVVFDSEATTLVPLQERLDEAAVEAALEPLEPGGGTSLYPALIEALAQLEGVDAPARHVVVMTDGLSQPGDFPGVLAQFIAAGISVSTVGIGEGADETVLADIARNGGGVFHATRDFEALPGILSQEALLLSGAPIEEGTTAVEWRDRDSPLIAQLPESMPPVDGYVLTTAKPSARVHLAVTDPQGEEHPLLASWRYGNGNVVSLATQGAGDWTRSWIESPAYPGIWAGMLRQAISGTSGRAVDVRLARRGDTVAATIAVFDRDGLPRSTPDMTAAVAGPGQDGAADPLPLRELAPGRYGADFPADQPGDYTVSVTADGETTDAAIHVAYPARYDFSRSAAEGLLVLAEATGGTTLAAGAAGPRRPDLRLVARSGWPVWTILALWLLLLELILRYAPGFFRIARMKPLQARPPSRPADGSMQPPRSKRATPPSPEYAAAEPLNG
jgi:uncharacterized membrane protein